LARDHAYLAALRRVDSEVAERERLLARLGQRFAGAARGAKLQALLELEAESRSLLAMLVDRTGVIAMDPAVPGRSRLRRLAGCRWIEFVEGLLREIGPRIAQLEQIERRAPVDDVGVVARVVAHHVAIQSFLRLELMGRGRESIDPLRALAARRSPAVPLVAAAG